MNFEYVSNFDYVFEYDHEITINYEVPVVLIVTIKINLTSQTFYIRSKEPTRCNQHRGTSKLYLLQLVLI